MAEVVSWDMKCRATAFSVPTRSRAAKKLHGQGEQREVVAVTNNQKHHRKQSPGLMAVTGTPAYLQVMSSKTPC